VLALSGVDGKLFRPMALTVVFALVTALVLGVTTVPAAAAVLMTQSEGSHAPPFAARWLSGVHDRLLRAVQGWRRTVAALAVVLLVVGTVLAARAGVEFTPQLDEGDLVIQVTRAPDLSLESHVLESARFERVIKSSAPEVLAVVSRLGSPAVATDVMGVEQADVFVRLAPRQQWRPGLTREALVAQIETALQREAPGGEPGFTQPIQMRFNELIGGAVTDVAVSIYGEDLAELRRLGVTLAAVASGVHGAADVRVMTPDDVSLVDVSPRHVDAARAGFTPRSILTVVQSLRAGLDVGVTFDGQVRVPVVLRLGEEANAFTVENEPVPMPTGAVVPLQRVAEVRKFEGPAQIARRQAMRRIVVGFNVRGADLGSVVGALKTRLKAEVPMPDGYRLEWGGQYETLEEARARLNVVVPVVLLLIALVLLLAFGRARPAAIILTHVPFAAVGGVVALVLRGMALSLPAVIGFIALSGVAVLNGVVLMTRILERQENGQEAGAAALAAARERARPVLTTALVAALGFVPMMLATGVGAEVQRPLATVVVGGLVTSTLLTLIVLPTTYGWFGGKAGR
jgi:cobalt-zinc-cadmium resistance protein CzcA